MPLDAYRELLLAVPAAAAGPPDPPPHHLRHVGHWRPVVADQRHVPLPRQVARVARDDGDELAVTQPLALRLHFGVVGAAPLLHSRLRSAGRPLPDPEPANHRIAAVRLPALASSHRHLPSVASTDQTSPNGRRSGSGSSIIAMTARATIPASVISASIGFGAVGYAMLSPGP